MNSYVPFRLLPAFFLLHLWVAMAHAKTLKCTDKDPRELLYEKCMQAGDRVLWCDESTLKSIPDPDTVHNCKTCRNSVALRIEDNCLKEISKFEIAKYPNLRKFNCTLNFITTIEASTFIGNGKLRALDFSSNRIKRIQRSAFHGLTKLESLNLTNNRISQISLTMFTDLVSLKELSLQVNWLQVLRSRSFYILKNLKVLNLSGNKISHIQPKAFANLKNLERLHLDGNELYKLDQDLFSYTPNLQVLTLSYNSFTAVPLFSVNTIWNLHTLNLAHNLLEELTIAPMSNLSKLQNLSLQNNSLFSIPGDSFQRMPLLRYLNLSSNRMEEIGECAFCHNCNLEVLSLSNNSLKTPHPQWFTSLIDHGAFTGIEINGNEWKCDCDTIPFYDFLTELESMWTEPLNINCSWPKKHHGKNLFAVIHDLRDLECSDNHYKPVQRQCNVTSPPTTKKETHVFTFTPQFTSTTGTAPETNTYEEDTSELPVFSKWSVVTDDNTTEPTEFNSWLVVGMSGGLVFAILLVFSVYFVYRLGKKSVKPKKQCDDIECQEDSRYEGAEDPMIPTRTPSNGTTITSLSVESYSSNENETAPTQPQDDLTSSMSDSGKSTASRCSPSEVDVSTDDGLSLSTTNTYSYSEISKQTSKDSGRGNTIPKEVTTGHAEDVSLLSRCDPIGGNDSGGVH